ncbi:SDR family oxidoreductase [Flavobacterium sp.]|uniref:SDR family oxidoreductase n=1 Tax=Flavobacterium sp. TaxID=239 RepID=UPI0026319B91|nr:SDR family oxidoreductase [Flavobacterium sp.]
MESQKKVILVTGASSGIGLAIAEYLAQNGHRVYGTSRSVKTNPLFTFLEMDVRDESSVKTAVQTVIERENRIDVVVNNAGVGITGPLEETPLAEAKNHFDTNFFGAISVMQAVLPQLRKQQSGLIINVTSIAGYMGLPFRGIYSAGKAALEVLTEAVRLETAQFNIKICNVAPGDFATNIADRRYHAPVIENSAYAKTYGATLNEINSHVNSGSNPIEMAQAIEKIINTSEPKIHYKVGLFMQKFSIVLKRVLPDLTYEKMLRRHFKL